MPISPEPRTLNPEPSLLDGSRVAAELLDAAAGRVAALKGRGVTPCLATILVGADPASVTYTQMKRRRCEKIGMTSRKVELPAETTTDELIAAVRELADDAGVHGILLQHPCPGHINERAAFEAIPVDKDVDGVTFGSFARMWFPPPKVQDRPGSSRPPGSSRQSRAAWRPSGGFRLVHPPAGSSACSTRTTCRSAASTRWSSGAALSLVSRWRGCCWRGTRR